MAGESIEKDAASTWFLIVVRENFSRRTAEGGRGLKIGNAFYLLGSSSFQRKAGSAGAFCLSLSFVCRSFVLLFALAVHHHCICCTTGMKAEIIFPQKHLSRKTNGTLEVLSRIFSMSFMSWEYCFLECHYHKLSATFLKYRFPHSLWYIFKIISVDNGLMKVDNSGSLESMFQGMKDRLNP